MHLDPNPRNGLGRRVGHGPGEGFGRGVETKLKADAAARLLSGFRYPVTNPGLPRLLSVLALGTVFVTRVVPFPLVALVPRRAGSGSDSRLVSCSGSCLRRRLRVAMLFPKPRRHSHIRKDSR